MTYSPALSRREDRDALTSS